MHGSGLAADDRSWRRNGPSRTAPQSIPTKNPQPSNTRSEQDQDNWRSPSNANKSPDLSRDASSLTNGNIWSHQRNRSGHNGNLSASHSTSLLSSSLRAGNNGDQALQGSSVSPAVKPSSMGNGIIGRSAESTSPLPGRGSGLFPNRNQWPLSSSLEKSPPLAPATLLPPLRIEHTEGSRFFPTHSTPSRPLPSDTERGSNRTFASNGGTSHRTSHSQDRSTDTLSFDRTTSDTSSSRMLPPAKPFADQSQLSAPRTSSPAATSAFPRNPAVNLHSSPKRSPLVPSAFNPRALNVTGVPSTLYRSPVASPMVAQRTLSPASRQTPFMAESQTVNTISSVLTGPSAFSRPGYTSRRESFSSATSGVSAAGHSLSHSRRSSAVLSPHSPVPSGRIGVYRPPHLRNRGSFSGLKPSVAHYDRVRTPSLRGISRSRESSISLSRPPSTIPFHSVSDAALEEGQVREDGRLSPRGRPGSFSIHLPDLIAEQQQRTAAAATEDTSGEIPTMASDRPREPPHDSASMLANLRAQLVRREAAASDAVVPDVDRHGTIFENEEHGHDAFDMSDMIEYGMADGYPISRHSSMYPGSERLLKEVFEIGDLLGPGVEHDGHIINIAETTPGFVEQNADLTGSKLEVIRKLGEGSYAVVYLVKEVDPDTVSATPAEKLLSPEQLDRSLSIEGAEDDPDLTMIGRSPSEDLLSSTLKAKLGNDDSFHSSPALERRRRKDLRVKTHLQPGKEFALKCLCKRDLPEDMLEVQRLEATIHQSIPAHPNIVTLYRTYETPDWLFLVLEYCPGQDLYYWLEQAQDSGSAADHHNQLGLDDDDNLPKTPSTPASKMDSEIKLDATPPSPSILASTSDNLLLSKRRIRLVARMFRQICDAVQFCHDRGISHRDIKPENFIVEDRRTLDEMLSATADMSSSTLIGSSRDGDDMQVIVKMTDFGLATAAEQCDDFDCGSKPYMAFECHNNISSTYDPKQADIWSLGIVLLNMLFHRSPFTEPSLACQSFTAYCQDSVRFLMESFDGLSETVAKFLRDKVFCEISNEPGHVRQRISAGEFAKWASRLVEHMGLGKSGADRVSRGGSIYSTMPLVHSRTASMSTLPSMMNSPSSRSRSMTLDPGDGDINPDATYRGSFASPRALSPTYALYSPDVLPSPTFTPLPGAGERNPFEAQYTPSNLGYSTRIHQEGEKQGSMQDAEQRSKNTVAEEAAQDSSANEQTASNTVVASDTGDESDAANVEESEDADHTTGDAEAAEGDTDKPESITTSNHSKRRKRGARKGRTLAKQLKRSQSVENMGDINSNDPAARAKERERTIRELALASQSLARQMSRIAKPGDGADDGSSAPVVLSKPTAEAAARYNLQSLAQETDSARVDASQHEAATSPGLLPSRGSESASQVAANWNSAAQRRERMIEQRKGGAGLEDSGRGPPVSWRDRNQSTNSVSSFASSINTVSSLSSTTSATSSIFSTTSAPAALTRKDYSRRNGTRTSGFGLDTISERERTIAKREVDAQYLAGIFGGGADSKSQDKKKKDAASSNGATAPAAVATAIPGSDKSERGRLFNLLSESKDKSSSTTLLSTQSSDAASQDQRSSAQNGVRAVSNSSVASNGSGTGTGSTFVSRFRRPTSSSSSTKSPALLGSDPLQPVVSIASTTGPGDDSAGSPVSANTDAANDAPAAAGKKQRGVGKFLLGVRDSMKNF